MTGPSVRELFWAFARTGARGFGSTWPWARRMLVDETRWLTAEEFTDVFNIGNFLPGPNVINVAVIVGTRFRGLRGALAAFLGLLSLPFCIVLALGAFYTRFGQLPGIDGVLRGIGAAAAGLMIAMGVRMAMPLLPALRAVGFMAVTFVAIAIMRLPLVPVLLVLAPLGVLLSWTRRP